VAAMEGNSQTAPAEAEELVPRFDGRGNENVPFRSYDSKIRPGIDAQLGDLCRAYSRKQQRSVRLKQPALLHE
jgi:hypothetical protein